MGSPSKHQRKSLGSLFTDLDISRVAAPSSPAPSSPQKRSKMRQNLRATISRGWPSMRGLDAESMAMTIRADDVYCQYAEDQDPQKLFQRAASWISTIQLTKLDETQQELVHKEVHEAMIRAIFGSNMIERAGLGWDVTLQLCRQIFAGEDVGVIPPREEDYQAALVSLYTKEPSLRNTPAKYILRGRNEIIQHAKAFQYIIHAFVAKGQDMSEELIKETHRILTTGIPIETGDTEISPEEYGGAYRTIAVCAGNTNFTVPKFVPAKMAEMCKELKAELAAAEANNCIDPFSVAAKYSLQFVQIHPFRDGNGRMCRMILNALLCRYAGVIVPIGEHGEEREEYMAIKQRSSRDMEGHGEYATFVLRRAFTRVREMKKKLSKGRGR